MSYNILRNNSQFNKSGLKFRLKGCYIIQCIDSNNIAQYMCNMERHYCCSSIKLHEREYDCGEQNSITQFHSTFPLPFT